MDFEQAMGTLVEQGAIRAWRVSGDWYFVYRMKDGRLEARGMNKVGEGWKLQDRMVGKGYYREDGWYPVVALHPDAEPIEMEAAKKNPGYYRGLTRRCETCKLVKPLAEFERDWGEKDYRSWECNECAEERLEEVERYRQEERRRVGDYVDHETHAARPPVKGEG